MVLWPTRARKVSWRAARRAPARSGTAAASRSRRRAPSGKPLESTCSLARASDASSLRRKVSRPLSQSVTPCVSKATRRTPSRPASSCSMSDAAGNAARQPPAARQLRRESCPRPKDRQAPRSVPAQLRSPAMNGHLRLVRLRRDRRHATLGRPPTRRKQAAPAHHRRCSRDLRRLEAGCSKLRRLRPRSSAGDSAEPIQAPGDQERAARCHQRPLHKVRGSRASCLASAALLLGTACMRPMARAPRRAATTRRAPSRWPCPTRSPARRCATCWRGSATRRCASS